MGIQSIMGNVDEQRNLKKAEMDATWHGYGDTPMSETDAAVEALVNGTGGQEPQLTKSESDIEPTGHVKVVMDAVRGTPDGDEEGDNEGGEEEEPVKKGMETQGLDALSKAISGKSEEPLEKAYLGSGRRDKWSDQFQGFSKLYLQALELEKENIEVGRARDAYYASMPSVDKDPVGYMEHKKSYKDICKRDSDIRNKASALEEKLLDAKIEREKRYQSLEKSELTSAKAKEILEDGEVHGKPLTEQQRKYFGAVASGKVEKSMDAVSGECPGNVQEENMGLQAMESFLQKSGMPTGDHSKLQKPKSQTQGASPDGGSLEGVGKTSGSNNGAPGPGQDADGQLKTSKSKKQKLSEDDADDEKQMKPHKKPIETVRKSLHPASQREMVAHENAVKVSQLRKGQPDVRVLSADDQASNLVSGDGFYYGDSPTLELRKSAPIHTGQQCPSCEETFSKSLSACPGCGHGTVGHRPTPSQFIGDAGDRPLLRKSMEPQDVMVGGPVEPVRLVSSGGVLRRR